MTLSKDDLIARSNAGESALEIALSVGLTRQAISMRLAKLKRAGVEVAVRARGNQGGPATTWMVDGDQAFAEFADGQRGWISAMDLPLVDGRHWMVHRCGSGLRYLVFKAGGRRQYMHRLLLAAPTGLVVDHIDGDGLNNRRSNIRLCTQAENTRNRRAGGAPKGVSRRGRKWGALIKVSGHNHWLGLFDTEEAAVEAYDEAARRLHGDFARPNIAA